MQFLARHKQLTIATIALLVGFIVIPALIFFAGATLLGRYEGASLGATYGAIFRGLGKAAPASLIVVLGPYALWLLFRALQWWWKAVARPA